MPRAVAEFQNVQGKAATLRDDWLSGSLSSRLRGSRKLSKKRLDLSARSHCVSDLDRRAMGRATRTRVRDNAPARPGPASQPALHQSAGSKYSSKDSCSSLRPSV